MTGVKICGLKDPELLRAAVGAGADYVGLVFYPGSPRHIEPAAAQALLREIPADVSVVGLFVNPTDKELRQTLSFVKPGMIQLHGDESPLRIIEIRAAYKIPVMKAIRVAGAQDLNGIEKYEAVSDWLLFDTKVEGQAGGTGKTFDWTLLEGRTFKKPWMLSGGLNAANVGGALNVARPDAVDVSSGVESAPGVKDAAKIRAFIEAVTTHG